MAYWTSVFLKRCDRGTRERQLANLMDPTCCKGTRRWPRGCGVVDFSGSWRSYSISPRVLRCNASEGWMSNLIPSWSAPATSGKVLATASCFTALNNVKNEAPRLVLVYRAVGLKTTETVEVEQCNPSGGPSHLKNEPIYSCRWHLYQPNRWTYTMPSDELHCASLSAVFATAGVAGNGTAGVPAPWCAFENSLSCFNPLGPRPVASSVSS
ncbi:uncharacterized protein LY79DRAFT_580687 [Colletotrichum navitas]|uniref:Uncharacterized protein n=1 Tax=Colletotrichum navitas TaxID=681940 RepID=A0AAD8PYH4_9PEZI|nr:uncharacterized protein LY79DRAFT_580687 [Colletotrichum navitas]KAK1586053.1 hypothetical protein LY79DRAFT_580687 [Colletotrichum navitas]